jgi:hypothetical protein
MSHYDYLQMGLNNISFGSGSEFTAGKSMKTLGLGDRLRALRPDRADGAGALDVRVQCRHEHAVGEQGGVKR